MTKAPAAPPPLSGLDRLRFLVRLVETNLQKLKSGPPGDLMNLCYDLRRYGEALGSGPDEIRKAERGDLSALAVAIEPVRKMVAAVADRGLVDLPFTVNGKARLDARGLGTDFDAPALAWALPLRDRLALLALTDLRQGEGVARVRRCKESKTQNPKTKEPNCQRLFVAKRSDQVYCTRHCANRVAVRTHQESKARRSRKQEAAR